MKREFHEVPKVDDSGGFGVATKARRHKGEEKGRGMMERGCPEVPKVDDSGGWVSKVATKARRHKGTGQFELGCED